MCANFCRGTWQSKVYYERKSFCNSQNASDVIGAVSYISFTKLTSFNMVLFTVVDDVKTMKDKMLEEGATNAQTGHFYVQNKPKSDNQGNITCMFSSH